MNTRAHPTILAVSGLDPGGGAGAHADIETITALGARARAAVTCYTRQDSVNAHSCEAGDADVVRRRITGLAATETIAAVKIGLTPTAQIADAVADALAALPGTPVVLDPVLAAGGGYVFCDEAATAQIIARLLPLATVATPNLAEAARLAAGAGDASAMAERILESGCGAVLITGESEDGGRLRHRLYDGGAAPLDITCERLAHRYHGSGCTLSSALAVELARGLPAAAAARRAHDYTYRCLLRAPIPRRGNPVPRRRET